MAGVPITEDSGRFAGQQLNMDAPSLQSNTRSDHDVDVSALTSTLCELGRVQHLEELGRAGPLTASAGEESLFRCLFGRDALRMAADLLDDFPAVVRSTLIQLA